MTDDTKARLQSAVTDNKVFLFMKGTPEFPQCGFSARVVQCLQAVGAQFASTDVLADQSIRAGVKEFSNWPTIPQVYVNGEFIGGCDIVYQMYQNGELADLIKQAQSA